MADTKQHRKSRPVIRVAFCLLALLSFSGCAPQPLDLTLFTAPDNVPEQFSICHGYGCLYESEVRLSGPEWADIKKIFDARPESAGQERKLVAAYIAAMEHLTGSKTGTAADVAGATILGHDFYQLDCIDETVNTSLYLSFIEAEGLLRFHDLAPPVRRGAFIDGRWPHNASVIQEKETGQAYVVDSWYTANGEEPHILPTETWLAGWRPSQD